MKPMVIYHGNCADGFSAAWCFWRKYGDGADYEAGVYGGDPPDVTGRHALETIQYVARIDACIAKNANRRIEPLRTRQDAC